MSKTFEVQYGTRLIAIPDESPTNGKESVHELVIESPSMNVESIVLRGTGDQLLKMLTDAHGTVSEMIAFELASKRVRLIRKTCK